MEAMVRLKGFLKHLPRETGVAMRKFVRNGKVGTIESRNQKSRCAVRSAFIRWLRSLATRLEARRRFRLRCPNGQEVIPVRRDGAGLSGTFCVDHASDSDVEGCEYIGVVRLHADPVGHPQEPTTDAYGGGVRYDGADAPACGIS